MKYKVTLLLCAFAACCMQAKAKGIYPVDIDNYAFDRHGDYMVVDMALLFASTEVESSKAQIFTPMIVSEKGDTVALPSVGIYGRQRYLQYLRNGRKPVGMTEGKVFKASERPDTLAYHADTDFLDWMDTSRLIVRRSVYGCTNCLVDSRTDELAEYFKADPAIPEIVYFETADIAPVTESIEGNAFVDFPVNKTYINPSYRNNMRELGKIQASIDTVLNDKDVTITEVWLKGYASPESPYSHNRELAIGRTEALKKHIGNLYKFREGIIATDFEPEDWQGLRKLVEKSNLANRDEILSLIDTDMDPDAKEMKIKKAYPDDYRFMLENFYPGLRHTDYRVSYQVNRFDNIDKIREVMRKRPSRLTLRDFFLLGAAAEPGSEEFNNVYETAVRMYPDNPVANINAANAALRRRDFATAQKYLERAGDSPEAMYAKGALAFAMGELDNAEALMLKALPLIPAARSTLDEIIRIRKNQALKEKSITLQGD